MQKPRLSQSLLKELVSYYDANENGCGLVIFKKYFEGKSTPQSAVQKLGTYFEYKATEYVRAGDPIPEPEMVYKGTAKEKLAADYEKANQSAQLFKEMVKKHGIEITKVGEYMLYDGCSGISDVRAKWNGEDCIIDLKYTSLIDDKFNEYGWHTESLVYKPKLLLQPIHYKYLIKGIEGIENIPFYFFIFSSKDPDKAKIIKANIQDEHITLHEEQYVSKMKRYIDFFYNNPDKLEARPTYQRCQGCHFFNECDKRAEVPLIEEIHY
jgi:hypothetical protein